MKTEASFRSGSVRVRCGCSVATVTLGSEPSWLWLVAAFAAGLVTGVLLGVLL